jgi:phosphoglucosamine mutase
MFEATMETADSADLGKAQRVTDAYGRYIEACKASIQMGTRFSGLKVVLDCAHGATYHIAPSVFIELGANVITIGDEPDGLNINHEMGSTSPEALRQKVLAEKADLGIAFDGDGDRVIMVDAKGTIVDGDELLYIIACSRLRSGVELGGVVGTQMSNMGMELAIRGMGLEFERVAVGDRYVLECLKQKNWVLGGESSGHIICLDRTTTGDGIVSALQVLEHLVETGQSLAQARAGMHKMPQCMINVKLTGQGDPLNSAAVKTAVANAEKTLNGCGRVLLRPSGTEPLVRVMVEGDNEVLVNELTQSIASSVRAAL